MKRFQYCGSLPKSIKRKSDRRIAERDATIHKMTLRVAALQAEMAFLRDGSQKALHEFERQRHDAEMRLQHAQTQIEDARREVLMLSETEQNKMREVLGLTPTKPTEPESVVMAQYKQVVAERDFHQEYGRQMKTEYDQLLSILQGLQTAFGALQTATSDIQANPFVRLGRRMKRGKG